MSQGRVSFRVPNSPIWLMEFTEYDAGPLFALIDRNRAHLSQFDDVTADKYPTEQAVLESIVDPKNLAKIRLGIWDGSVLIGTMNLTPEPNRRYELGYWIGSEFGKRGYATRCAKRVVSYALKSLNCVQVIATAHKDNRYSQAVLRKAGLVQEAIDGNNIHFATVEL